MLLFSHLKHLSIDFICILYTLHKFGCLYLLTVRLHHHFYFRWRGKLSYTNLLPGSF